MKYTSEELNKKIGLLDTLENSDELAIKGGKCIPYIGWFWRNVNFDAETYSFGIICNDNFTEEDVALGLKPVEEQYFMTGFMENNKWNYPYTRHTTKEEWIIIKDMLCEVVDNTIKENVTKLWNYIQDIK